MEAHRTILIVDDQAPIRTILCDYFADHGYHVVESPSAAQALRELSACTDIELVIADIVMPGSPNGFELGRRLAVEHPDVKILFMSGDPDAAQRLSAMSKPVELVAKPFRLPALLQRVQNLIAAA
jgi:CheY-like chemotaxis protein